MGTYTECYQCGGKVRKITKTKNILNETLKDIIEVTVPAYECVSCAEIVYPQESFEILQRCSGGEG